MQSIITTTYVFSLLSELRSGDVGDIKFIFKLLCAQGFSPVSTEQEIDSRGINDIFIVIKKIEILT